MNTEFWTGPAGTGKTEIMRKRAAADPSSLTITSTTGISAMNLGTCTLNSLLTYYNTESLARKFKRGALYRTLENLADGGVLGTNLGIDEVSMMEAEQLDIITEAMERTFGGRRGIVIVGDFNQLPPVEGQFAFHAENWPRYEKNMVVLDKIWRQHDAKFLEALGLIRRGVATQGAEALANAGAIFSGVSDSGFDGVTLVPTNAEADAINGSQIAKLPGMSIYVSVRKGKEASEWNLIPKAVLMKPGAKIMITANAAGMANGDLGVFVAQGPTPTSATVRLDRTGEELTLWPVTRINLDWSSGPKGQWIGEITFMPLKLAYALTIHRCQGLTLPKAQLHVKHWFSGEPALIYVAVSRVRSAANLSIIGTVKELEARIKAHPEARRWL